MFIQTGVRRAVVLLLAIVLLVVLCAGLPVASSIVAPQQAASAVGSLDQLSREFREVASRVEPSVVRIEIRGRRPAVFEGVPEDALPGSPEEFFRRFFDAPFGGRMDEPQAPDSGGYRRYDVPKRVGAGSGWIYDRRGHVVTNHHVVQGAEAVVVKLHDGREFPARVVATDAATDVALLAIEARDLTPAALAQEPLEQGDIVFAFGSPLEFEFSMSQGIVSGKGRRTGILGPSGYEDFIQTDAAINPGNSGGPLTNVRAEVVGMNSSIVTGSGLFGGIGFAIPIAMIRPVVEQMIEFQTVRRGQLGIFIQDDPDVLKSFGYEGPGAVVSDVVPGGPADKVGIRAGDVVTKLDGEGVANAAALRQAIAARRPGSSVRLSLFRDKQTRELEVELGEVPSGAIEAGAERNPDAARGPAKVDEHESLRKLGIEEAATLSAELAQRLGSAERSGVLVQRVRANSAAQAAGLRPGLVILRVMDAAVASVDELARALAKHDLVQGVRLTVRSDGQDHYLFVRLPK